MHSLRGAFSETLYIYGTAIETALEQGFSPQFLSMGLGLGYNELLVTACLLKHPELASSFYMESFESEPELRECFLGWLDGQENALTATYDQVLQTTATHFQTSPEEIRQCLQTWQKNGQWVLREALEPATLFARRFSCLLFDAFSSKTTPELWSEEFLIHFFTNVAEAQCVYSTYACTGALKRALRHCGFTLQIRQGYSSKRDSTFAVRS